jgi:NADH-quinone oxidoreductase subunit C
MTDFAISPEALQAQINETLGSKAKSVTVALGEVTVVVPAADYFEAARLLRDAPGCKFEQLIDLCGMDYSDYREGEWEGERFCVVSHLLSVSLNQRVRLKVFVPNEDLPVVDSLTGIWNAATWFEREAFDLYGVIFRGHPDLRRILTDYGFIGHPFRKDFPLIGNVEVRYDEAKKRVIYQPVSIEPRVLVPKVIREDHRYEPALKDTPPRIP